MPLLRHLFAARPGDHGKPGTRLRARHVKRRRLVRLGE